MEIHLAHIQSICAFVGKKHSRGYYSRFSSLFFEDESYVKLGVGRRQCLSDLPVHRDAVTLGKALQGVGTDGRRRPTQKINMWAVVCAKGVVALHLTPDNGNDAVCLRFFTKPLPSDAIVGSGQRVFDIISALADKPVLFVDRLGGGGRGAENAVTQHFNPLIKEAATTAGVGYRLLPPYGAFENPCETFWDDFKGRLLRTPPPGPPRYDSHGHRIRGPTTWDEFKTMARQVVEKMNRTPSLFRSYIYRRGLGAEFHKRWSRTQVYMDAQPHVVLYDIVARSFQPQVVDHDDAPPATRARAAAYARWWYAHACLGPAMLPATRPPGPAGPCGSDDYENTCRMCGTAEPKKRPKGELLLCDADGCTAAWHTKCLALDSVPAGQWFCPCCTFAPGKPTMPRWPPQSKAKGNTSNAAHLVSLAGTDSDSGGGESD